MSDNAPCDLSALGAQAFRRLDRLAPALAGVADWTENLGRELSHGALADSIPFTLRSLANEIGQIRDGLAPFTEADHG
jgi:hypothetical protein